MLVAFRSGEQRASWGYAPCLNCITGAMHTPLWQQLAVRRGEDAAADTKEREATKLSARRNFRNVSLQRGWPLCVALGVQKNQIILLIFFCFMDGFRQETDAHAKWTPSAL